jgi:hypothetical protein
VSHHLSPIYCMWHIYLQYGTPCSPVNGQATMIHSIIFGPFKHGGCQSSSCLSMGVEASGLLSFAQNFCDHAHHAPGLGSCYWWNGVVVHFGLCKVLPPKKIVSKKEERCKKLRGWPKSTPTCWHFKSTCKGHWPWQLFSKGPQPSPKFPLVTLYPTHNCVIHFKDTISQPPFSTSPTKYRKSKFLDFSIVA